jgi:hypothetical protein
MARALSVIALVLSLAAIGMSVLAMRRDPLGTDLSRYDLSSPEQTLRSINKIIAKQDIRAALEFVRTSVWVESGGDKEAKLFLADNPTLTVLKSLELSNSGEPKNNGVVVSFVKFNVSGVDYYAVKFFRKDQSGRFLPAERPSGFGSSAAAGRYSAMTVSSSRYSAASNGL